MDFADGWEKDASTTTDRWYKRLKESGWDHAVVDQVEATDRYIWRVTRRGFSHSGIKTGRGSTMGVADDLLNMPIDQFNKLVAVRIREEIASREQDLLKLQPETDVSPGYVNGFHDGVLHMKQKIMAVLS